MTRCSACGARARKLRNAHVIIGRRIKPGRVCSSCERLGWLLVLGEDKPRPTTKRELERQLRGASTAAAAFKRVLGPSCGAVNPAQHGQLSALRCELERGHAGKHVASLNGTNKQVRWGAV